MTSGDATFTGSIPQLYDQYLGPLLFEPYAEEVARRTAALQPSRILETAAGTGIVTAALQRACPDAQIVATDLNQAMLDVAERRSTLEKLTFRQADALELPFVDGEFDLVVCQFGVMFYPDKVRGNAEARRVLRDGGTYIVVIWDSLEQNPVSDVVHRSVQALYPDDPPTFLERAPFGHDDRAEIEQELRAAGFETIEVETVKLKSRSVSAADAARGLVAGCPLAAEILERDAMGLDRAIHSATAALRPLETNGALDSDLSAHIATATK
jgi:ubiquinone/menaquinone biosynthesis C-methylase UbiE